MKKEKGLILLSLLLALVAAGTVYWYIQNLQAAIDNSTKTETIVVAREEIPRLTVIRGEMLEEKRVPLGLKIPGAYGSAQELVGRVTVDTVFPGQQPVLNQIAELGKGEQGLSFALTNGKRAVSVPVNEVTAVAGYPLPGDLVDVAATFSIPDGDQELTLNTFVIEKVRLLALGFEGPESGRTEAMQQFSSATLEVSADQVSRLALAADKGSIRLVLRPALDEGYSSVKSQELGQFIDRR